MKHETKLAAALSTDQDLTEYFHENYSADELADFLMEKRAFPGAGMLAAGINRAAPMIRSGVKAVGGATMGQAAGIGAAGGAALGAGRHLLSRRDPQTGQKRTSLLGSMAGGAALGAGAGLGARAGAQAFESTGLHKRMISGDFKFAPRGAVQPGLPGMDTGVSIKPPVQTVPRGGGGMPTPAPAPQKESLMRRAHRWMFGGGAPAQTAGQ